MKKMIALILLAAAGGYWTFLSKPSRYYANSLEYKCFTLRTRGELPAGVETVLDRALGKISASEFFSPETRFDLYLTGGPLEYGFSAPFLAGDYARVNPVNGGIFLTSADFTGDKIRTAPETPESRVLSKVIASAAAREMARRSMEPLAYLVERDWEFIGYGERISGSQEQFTPADICAKDAPEGSALREYEYGLAVSLLMDEEKISFADLLRSNYSYEGAERQLKKRLCAGR